ncbi:hypothetical protein GQ53DRAFT_745977 [Thozetella sp. PMI_491]|nr:hypothetical protein GQ53DRAFT_745977 [Thozetella sp. PMI_491]
MGNIWSKPVRAEARREKPTPRVRPTVKPSSTYMAPHSSIPIPAYFWGEESWEQLARVLPRHTGHVEAGQLIGDGDYTRLDALVTEALEILGRIYRSIDKPDTPSSIGLVDLSLSEDLQQWKREQHKAGRVLPSKGFGLKRTTDEVARLLGAEEWPAPLLTNNTIFGVGWANLGIGAYDAATLYSNYCCDMAFYYEHGFHKVFPEFESVFHKAGNADPHALSTFAGPERRKASELGVRYIRSKVNLETKHLSHLAGKSARLDRRDAQVISFSESSLIGMAAEAMTRGFDPAAVMADMVFSSPATDVIDVGSDLGNSEVMNSFLNTADVTDTGVVTEEVLRRVYDAYSYTCARILTERWTTPTGIMNSQLYVWHMRDDRHFFLRRAVLGYSKVRKTKPDQREADMDEVFDVHYRTTGFSRPLKGACDGGDTCDQAARIIGGHPSSELLGQLWWYLVTGPLAYVRAGVVDGDREEELGVRLQEIMARCWHDGLVHETNWLVCHASHHAWQINFLMEAAMFGSLLDSGALAGKLDRAN